MNVKNLPTPQLRALFNSLREQYQSDRPMMDTEQKTMWECRHEIIARNNNTVPLGVKVEIQWHRLERLADKIQFIHTKLKKDGEITLVTEDSYAIIRLRNFYSNKQQYHIELNAKPVFGCKTKKTIERKLKDMVLDGFQYEK